MWMKEAVIRSSSYTAIRHPPISGATLFLMPRSLAAALRLISLEWGIPQSFRTAVLTPTAFFEHRKYLDELLDKLGIYKHIIFVVQDWGSVLGFDWARRHPGAVDGIVYTEALFPGSWSEMSEQGRKIFQALQSSEGEKMILEQNSFLNVNLPVNILRELTEEEVEHYHRPFIEPGESRRPMLSWARQLPFDSDSAVAEIMTANGNWLAQSPIPKLFLHTEQGRTTQSHLDFCRSWPEHTEVTVPGIHYPMEDAPDEVGEALAVWLKNLKRYV